MRSSSPVCEACSNLALHDLPEENQEERQERSFASKNAANQPSYHSIGRHRTFPKTGFPVPPVVVGGMLCCLLVAAYTHWLSRRVLQCPEWASECATSSFLKLNSNNIAVVQGIATIFYSIGLAAMAYGTECACESAIWPLLIKQHFSINQVETYLSAARESIASTIIGWRMISTYSTAFVLFISAITNVVPLVAAPLVGIVFDRGDILTEFKSSYEVANGIARIYVQTNPPLSMGANSQASFTAWGLNQSTEPLPEYRLWVVDRSRLFVRGNMKVRAVKAETKIICRATNVTEILSTKSTSIFSTRMAEHNWRQLHSSDRVQVQVGKALAVWVHDINFDHANKSSADLVFAAFNGSIENGRNTTLSNGWTVSSVLCKVGVEFVDKDFDIGDQHALASERPVLSSNVETSVPEISKNETGPHTLNENALWFAVAPLLVGMSVNGSQPLFQLKDGNLPTAYTRAPFRDSEKDYKWSTYNVTNFIEASIGAVAQASSRNSPTVNATIISKATTRRLYEGRALYLIIPVAVIALGQIMLLYWNVRMHHTEGLSEMRMAGFGELLKSALTDFFGNIAHENHGSDELSYLGEVYVRFGGTTLMDREVAGLATNVSRFKRGSEDEAALVG